MEQILILSINSTKGDKIINRYFHPEIPAVWSEENKYQAWFEMEILADEA